MSYDDKYGSTRIRPGEVDRLILHWDYEDNPEDKTQRFPVLFFTPDMNNTDEHYHIQLDKKQAEMMKDWFEAFLDDTWEEEAITFPDIDEVYTRADEFHIDNRKVLEGQIAFTQREIDIANKYRELGCMVGVASEFFVTRERIRQILAKIKRKCNKIRSEND